MEQLQALLGKYHVRFCDGFRVVGHQIVDEGTDDGKPAQLVSYRATATCHECTMKICGKIALSFDAEWKTYSFVSGFNYMPRQGMEDGDCDDESQLPVHCFGCGNKVLADLMRENGFQFSRVPASSKAKSTTGTALPGGEIPSPEQRKPPASRGTKLTAAQPSVGGALSPRAVHGVIHRNEKQIGECYAGQAGSQKSGDVGIKFVVQGNGRVASPMVTQSTLAIPDVESCVLKRGRPGSFLARPVVVSRWCSIASGSARRHEGRHTRTDPKPKLRKAISCDHERHGVFAY